MNSKIALAINIVAAIAAFIMVSGMFIIIGIDMLNFWMR